MIYLDNAATTPLSDAVVAAMTSVMSEQFGNPSSIHTYGRAANQLVRQARQTIAKALQTAEQHIIFTSGGSEANNMAIKGYALANQNKGKHLITTAIEHHSVLDAMAYLAERFGFDITYLQPENGRITAKQVAQALRQDTILVSVMAANNETGDLLPIAEIGQILQHHQAIFHVDAVQAVGKIEVRPDDWQVDLLSASAHKFHGPKGVGFLYAKPLHMDKLIHGGNQEHKRRASTENLIGIVGMAKALEDATNALEQHLSHVQHLKTTFLQQLNPDDFYLNESSNALPYIINIGFPGVNNATLLTQLDLAGYAVSTGSACTAGLVEPSHVLSAIYGTQSPRLKESIRISLSDQNTVQELMQFADTLHTLLQRR